MPVATANRVIINKDFKLPVRSKMYARRPAPVRAIKMEVEFEIETANGVISGIPGEYLVQDARGEFHTVSQETFDNTYEEVKIGR
jgi:hypothetical protein